MKIATIVFVSSPIRDFDLYGYLFLRMGICPEFVESEGGWLNNPVSMVSVKCYMNILLLLLTTVPVFEGLGDNTYFWNYTCGLALIISRYFANCRTGSYCRSFWQTKVHSGKCGYIKD